MQNDRTRQKLINEPTHDCNDKSYDRHQFSRQSLYSKSSFHSLYGDYSGVSTIKYIRKYVIKYDVRCSTFLYLICMYNIIDYNIIYVYDNRRAMVSFLLLHQHNRRRILIHPKMVLQGTGCNAQIMELLPLYESQGNIWLHPNCNPSLQQIYLK